MSKIRQLQCLTALIIGLGVVLHCYQWVIWDVSWLLELGRRVSHGGQYGREFFETNPPMSILLYQVSVWVGKITHWNDYTVVNLEGYGVTGLILWYSFYLCQQFFSNRREAAWYCIAVLAFVFTVVPANAFLERENFLVLLSMPYLIVMAMRFKGLEQPRRQGVISGVLAGIAYSIKPYYFITPLLLEFTLQMRFKGRLTLFRIENAMMLSVALVYLSCIYWFFPSYFSLLQHFIIPFYPYFGVASLTSLFLNEFVWLLPIVLALGRMLKVPRAQADLVRVFVLAAAGALASALYTKQLWYYHFLPYFSYAIILLVLYLRCFYCHYKNSSLLGWRAVVSLCLLIAGVSFSLNNIVGANAFSVRSYVENSSYINRFYHFFIQNKVRRAYVMSVDMKMLTAIDYAHVKNLGKFSNHWMVPFIAKTGPCHLIDPVDPKQIQFARQSYRRVIMSVFEQKKPDYVLIQNLSGHPYIQPCRFQFLTFLKKNARFRQVWKHYRLVKQIDRVQIYKRRLGHGRALT